MRLTATRYLRPVLAGLLAMSWVGAPSHVAAATTSDRLVIDSVDDYIGQGESSVLTDGDAVFAFVGGPHAPGEIEVYVSNPDTSWRLKFLPPTGETLHVGHYANAGVQPPITPELRVTHDSFGCGASMIGSFTIQELTFDVGGNPTSLAVTFEQRCDTSPGPLIGALRVNSDAPQALLSTPTTSRSFGNVTVGQTVGPRTFTVEAIGDLPVTVTSVAASGAAASDYPRTADGCSGVTLDPGETCSFGFSFQPSAIEDRLANLVIANNAPQGARVLAFGGFGRIPTATTVHVEPDWVYFQPGIKLAVSVAPPPDGSFECWLDGVKINTGGFSAGNGACFVPRVVGSHTFKAKYLGTPFHGDSQSSVLTFQVSSVTAVDLTASKSSVFAGVPITLTAIVSTASGLLYPGGSVTFRDVTTNKVIATRSIDAGSASRSVAAAFTAGTHQIQVTYSGVNEILNGSVDTVSINVLPDHAAPTATAPKQSFTSNVRLSAGKLPVLVTWAGADADSGVAGYQIEQQTSGGAWSAPIAVTAPSRTVLLATSHTYRFRVRAIDRAGNTGAWAYGATFWLSSYSETSTAAHYSNYWAYDTSSAFRGGHAKQASKSPSKVRFTFIGRSFGWLSLTRLNGGRASIYVNGVYQATVNLYSATERTQTIVWAKNWSKSASRTVEIRVLGTSSTPLVAIDGFWVAR